MCCLSKASSHFVVFVCVNPDRERLPSIESPKQKSLVRFNEYCNSVKKYVLLPPLTINSLLNYENR